MVRGAAADFSDQDWGREVPAGADASSEALRRRAFVAGGGGLGPDAGHVLASRACPRTWNRRS